MSRRNQRIFRALFSSMLALGIAPAAKASEQAGIAGDLSHLASNETITAVLALMVFLLLAMLLFFLKMRIKLERKTQALGKSERHIRLMGDNLPNVTIFQLVYTAKESFRFTYLSKGYDRILGFDRNLVLANTQLAYDLVYKDDLPRLKEAFNISKKKGTPTDFEFRVLGNSGQLKWLHVSAVPHTEEDLLIWDGFMQDVSVSKHVEDVLIEENHNLQNLFETIDDFLLVCDMRGKLIHTNPSMEKRLEYTRKELSEMSIFELYSEDSRAEICHVLAQMQTEPSTTCDQPILKRSGGIIPVEMSVFQGHWKNKNVIFGVARDVASHQKIETALRESQQMLQLIMDTIPMSVFWKDKDSIYLGCNKTFIRECGQENINDIIGKTPFDLFEHDVAQDLIERDQIVISNNIPTFNLLQSNTRIDGSIGWMEISKIPLTDDQDRAVGVLGVWRDVTEETRAKERLKHTLEDMERFNQLMRGRERRTLELKAEINSLLHEQHKPQKYRTTKDSLS